MGTEIEFDDYEAVVGEGLDESVDSENPSEDNLEVEDEDGSAVEEEVEEEDTPSELFTVTVDGKEEQVSLDELRNGYMRQAHFTRQSQSLAAERQRYAAYDALDGALRDNPEATILRLAQAYGLNLADNQPPQRPASEGTEDELDPLTELKQLRQWQAQVEQERAQSQQAAKQAAIEAELDAVRTRFNDPNLDDVALLSYAIDNRIGNLEKAYRAWRSEQQESAPKSKVVQGKKKVLPPVEGGQARSPKTSVRGSTNSPDLDESMALAYEELGLTLPY